jgi:6,7-dimethyl-8-ribityllumazine synthase
MNPSSPEIALLAADFNKAVVDAMVAAASAEASRLGARIVRVDRVPGCYELPFVANLVLSRVPCSALVVLGFIERGETLHGEVMGQVVHRALVELGLEHGKPIGLGIIGPGATPEQAERRKEDYAAAAVRAALAALEVAADLGA